MLFQKLKIEEHCVDLPTSIVKVERSPPERKVVSQSQPSHTKDLKNVKL